MNEYLPPRQEQQDDTETMDRRQFLGRALGIVSIGVVAGIAVAPKDFSFRDILPPFSDDSSPEDSDPTPVSGK